MTIPTSKYSLEFKFIPASSNDLLLGVLFLKKDNGTINEIRVASSYPGMQHSGSWNRKGGLIPPGDWEVRTKTVEGLSSVPGINAKKVGLPSNFYQIIPEIKTMSNGTLRGDFGIHFDGNAPGSLGCICPQTKIGWQRVIEFMAMAESDGISKIPLRVIYT